MTWLSLGFRPFFLGAGIFAVISMGLWMAVFGYHQALPATRVSPVDWHIHEMVYGYSLAVIAGFLLTAVGNWTGRQMLHGSGLLALFGLWALARLLFSFSDWLLLAAVLDTVFMIGLFIAIAVPCIQSRQWKQTGILSKVLLMLVGNSLFYLGATGTLEQGVHWGLYGGFYLIIGLILTMARRVVPFFIERGVPYTVQLFNNRWLDISSIVIFLVFFVSTVFLATPVLTAVSAFILFLVHTARLIGWHTPGLWKVPLLWSLYLSLVFIDFGFLLFVLSQYSSVTESLAIHAFAVGGIGLITFSMMSRVTLGHTGRDVQSPTRAMQAGLVLMVGATLARVLLPLLIPESYAVAIQLAQGLWILAFALFVTSCLPMLTRPRVD